MNKNLDRLVNDQICELICYRIGNNYNETYKIGFTEEMLQRINHGIRLNRENPNLMEMTFSLDKKVNYSLLYDWDNDELESRELENISVELDIPSFQWQSQEPDSEVDFIKIELAKDETKPFLHLQIEFSHSLRVFCYIDVDPEVKYVKTFREILKSLNVELEKKSYE